MTSPSLSLTDIAAGLPGHDPHNMHVAHVQAFLAQFVVPVTGSEETILQDALGRVLAHDLVSPMNVPPHDNAAMDGYAFDGATLAHRAQADGQVCLDIAGSLLAGKLWPTPLLSHQSLRIMTGAAMPSGADTVVPQELATRDGDHRVRFRADAVRSGANRRLAGEDLRQGAVALCAGQYFSPAALGLAASLGITRLRVLRRPRVAYFSTGDEVLNPGDAPRAGAIYDSNRTTLTAMLRRLGIDVIDLGVVRDDATALEAALRSAVASADAIISSGGMSVGEADHTRGLLQRLCADSGGIAFWQVAMRPGRPMAVGRIGNGADSPGVLLFGLPGNPVAAMVSFLIFVRPALLRLMGCTTPPSPPTLHARLAHALPTKRAGRTEYLRGIVQTGLEGENQVRTTGNQGSGILSSMVQANGLIVLPHEAGPLAEGTWVEVMPLAGLM